MTFQVTTRRLAFTAAALLIAALYLADLTGMGIVSTDEPRYADIGRAMARSGDWITPRLWGQAWFEKPPLLYWLIAIGFKAGLGPELAPRLPIAVFSLGFLLFFWFRLRAAFDPQTASISTAMLATTAGWLAVSHVAITDVPMAALFTAAILFAIEGYWSWAAASLGFAVLAKSLVPVILFFPVLAINANRWREWLTLRNILIFTAVAAPWHLAAMWFNGWELARVLFVQQQFGRFFSPERQHVQPWWFYFPVALLLLMPWFPLLPVATRKWRDPRVKTLTAVVLFGFAFFSASANKLPGYLIPLLPPVCAITGAGIAGANRIRAGLIPAIALLGTLPFALNVVPVALAGGLRLSPMPWRELEIWLGIGLLVGLSLFLLPENRGFGIAFWLAGLALLWFQFEVFPSIDRLATARPLWRKDRPACAPDFARGELYGLYYYSGGALPPCRILDRNPDRVVR